MTTMYGHKYPSAKYAGGFYFFDIYGFVQATRMIRPSETVYKLEVRKTRPGEKSPYWGWQDTGSDKFAMVYPSKVQVEMCFPYGAKAEEARGRGKLVNLVIKEIGPVGSS